jgi:RNA polymerase sigma-70 factor (ECF subfamily)
LNVTEADAATIARVRGGDSEAYAELVRRHAPVALRTAALLGAGPDAEDVVQEAFVKAFAQLDRFRDGAPFRPWLLRIVTNETRNLHRGTGRRRERERVTWARTERLLASSDPVDSALSSERRRMLVGALGSLAERDRQVVVCRYLLDLDESESATVLGWPRGTVKSRLSRALARLQVLLEEESHV